MAKATKAEELSAQTEERAGNPPTLPTDPYTVDEQGYICGDLWKVQPVFDGNEKLKGWEQATRKPERTNVKLNVAQVMEVNGAVSQGQKNPLMLFRKDGILFENQLVQE